ncbi:hypothetical protein F5Y14DRAFT_334961 [Nemania sp. NC0429]|nr:hypothetical protein F5Y14DRAFT_334961 [Nemania sp. NC0429]
MSVEATTAIVAPAAAAAAAAAATTAATVASGLPHHEPPSVSHDDKPGHGCNDGPRETQPGADPDAAHGLADSPEPRPSPKPIGLHSPPDSNGAMKLDGSDDDSELSDVEDPGLDPDQLPFFSMHSSSDTTTQTTEPTEPPSPGKDEEVDIGEVEPDHWSGTVPVFKPDMHQFKDFKKFMEKIDSYGMKSGIVKIIPPQEWKDNLPVLDDLIKQVRVREPIKQEIMGSNGTYRQVNILHQRSYNLPQWRQLCDQSEHQPPARRGERRAKAPVKPKGLSASTPSGPKKRSVPGNTSGRSTRSKTKRSEAKGDTAEPDERPMTPVSPRFAEAVISSVEQEIGDDIEDDDPIPPTVGRMVGSRQAKPKEQSTSARRKFARREGSAKIDEESFRDFDYQMDISDYTPERCEELERIYWKTLTYAPPLYGADVLGTLFNDATEEWNLNKLPNLLDVLGTKVPGVNTAYLYLGMWKATFAWHLEDVDLYSINYLHFGAPKQWYSISQGDARRFEAAMKSIWPTEAKACGQFLRHKAFLISPSHLQQYFNIKVNKCVSYPGEFVVTYPYGYHSGYNLGYNCAEAVNFALDSWLSMGKIAKKCECAQAQDSVWVDVYEIERKLRGEETDYEETDDEDEEEDEDDEDEPEAGLPTPRSTNTIKLKPFGRKRKRAVADKGEKKVKKIRLRLKSQVEPPCCLCPHDIPGIELLPTDDDRKAHRLCALYGAETWIETVDGKEVVANVANISKDRLDLKCLFCRSKRGTCFQCSHKKCARAYHATCAAAAGVFVEEAEVPVFSEDGIEYKEQAFGFSCRFHRAKRDRKMDGDALDDCQKTRRAASALNKGDFCQLQYHRGDIFAGIIIENRHSEQTFLLDILPNGDRVEVEWKWLLLPDPSDLHLPHASQNAIPMPTSRAAKELINATRKRIEELPRADEPFVEGGFVWAEFNHHDLEANKTQAKVDLAKENQIWHYLGRYSTDARPRYTEDPRKKQHNSKSNFLDSIPRPVPPPPPPRKSYGSTFSIHTPTPVPKTEKPYHYKPRDALPPNQTSSPFTAHQFVPRPSPYTAHQFLPKPSISNAFSHHTPAMTRPSNYPTPTRPAPLPSPLPYYKFHHLPYVPPQPQTQRPQQSSHKPQPRPTSELGPPSQQPLQLQQTTPHPIPYSTAQPVNPTHQPQPPLPRPAPAAAPSTPQAEGHDALTPPVIAHQQSISRRSSLPRPGPTQNANSHTRNKSSVSSHSGRLALGSGQRFGTPPSSYGHTPGDSITQSPFSHGFTQPPGLGPSPSPQNSQLFQTQARARSSSLVSNISLNTPMTSSAIRPSSSASAQALAGHIQSTISNSSKEPRPSVIQKYAFFQVHHNRDSTKYRTPYAHWGGFTNGYEGNLRAHLMRTPDALFGVRRSSVGFDKLNPGLSSKPHHFAASTVPSTGASNNVAVETQSPVMYHHPIALPTTVHSAAAPSAMTSETQSVPPPAAQPPMMKEQPNWCSSSAGASNQWDAGANTAALHPAIRAHYAALLQSNNVKAEGQPDTSGTGQTLTMFSPSPPAASAPLNMTAPPTTASAAPRLPSTSRVSSFAPGQAVQTKSTTPIPPPPVPAVVPAPQSTAMSISSVKSVPAVPKKTFIPAPRPWEALRKSQASAQPAMAQPSAATLSFTPPSSVVMTPRPVLPTYGQPESSRHPPTPGFQPNHVVSGSFRHFVPPTMPNSDRFNLPVVGCPPYPLPDLPSHPLHSLSHIHHHQWTQQDHVLPSSAQENKPFP